MKKFENNGEMAENLMRLQEEEQKKEKKKKKKRKSKEKRRIAHRRWK